MLERLKTFLRIIVKRTLKMRLIIILENIFIIFNIYKVLFFRC